MSIEQAEAKAVARRAFGGRPALFDRLSGVFDNAGIAKRHIVAPIDWYESRTAGHERNALYLEAAEDLFLEAASAAIAEAGLTPDQIDGVVTVSTTGIATPSLEARVGPRLGLRERRPPGARLRPRLRRRGQRPGAHRPPRRRRPGQPLAVRHRRDLLDLDPPRQRRSRRDCRHRLVRRRRRRRGRDHRRARALRRITGSAEKLWPDTLRIMGWDVEDPGLAVVFDRAIPPFIEAELAAGGRRDARADWTSTAAPSTASAATPAGSR